jgi:molecular chaperone GrpE
VTDDRTPSSGSGQPDPEEGPRVTDKRRIDPETGRLREPTPEEHKK